MDKILYNKAIQNIFSGVGYSIEGTDYSTLGFNTGSTTSNGTAIYSWTKDSNYSVPTEDQILEEYNKLVAEYEHNQYQRDRAFTYPSIQEQLDVLYHQGYDGWKARIDEVKNKYPKPGEDL
jgi:hypothetical protein